MAEAWLSKQAQVDCRTLPPAVRQHLGAAVAALESHPDQLRPLSGAPGWLVLRLGDHRLLLRPMTVQERRDCGARAPEAYLVARIVHWDEVLQDAGEAMGPWR